MSKTQGKRQDFFGMDIEGKLTINMKKHIQKAIYTFCNDITRKVATPARSYLFKVQEGIKNWMKREQKTVGIF